MVVDNLKKKFFLLFSSLFIILILYLFPTKKIDYINNTKNNYFNTYIYLIDKDNYVSRVNVMLSSSSDKDKIYEIIDYLTINGSKISYIIDGFIGIIPENTKLLSVKIDDNIVNLNFSKEFLNISKDNIDRLISSIIYSITSLNKDYKITFYVDNNLLTKFPNGYIIDTYLDRSFGINKNYDITSINGICETTVYYLSKFNDYYYYIPITMVNNNKEDKIKIIIEEMASKSIYQTNLISYLKTYRNIDYEINDNSILLNLNNNNFISDKLIEETIYLIDLSIKDNYNDKEVFYYINNILYKKM